ncbi:hypothetical protein [Nocardioides pyridinolyticus]
MSFRPDWRDFYDELAADPTVFQRTLRTAVESEAAQDQVWLTGRSLPMPTRLAAYLRGPAADLLHDDQLVSYVSAAESSRSTDPMVLDAQATLNRLRVVVEAWRETGSADSLRDVSAEASRLTELIHRRTDQPRLSRQARELEGLLSQTDLVADERADHAERFRTLIGAIEAELRELRRQSNLGAYAS